MTTPAFPRPLARRRAPGAARVLLAALALAACDDAPVTAPPQDGARLAAGTITLQDTGIDLSDTWLMTEATTTTTTTVQYAEPTTDPATGQVVSAVELAPVTETRRTEAGYGGDGTIRINEYYAGDPVSGVAHVQIVGDSVTYLDTLGTARTDLPGSDLVATLGSFRYDVVTDSMVIPYDGADDGADDPVTGDEPVEDGPAPAYSVSGGAGGTRREVVTDLGEPGMRGQRVRYYRRGPGAWVLDEERVEMRQEGARTITIVAEVTRYRNVAWRNDAARDALRRAGARRAGADAGVRSGGGFPALARLAAAPAPSLQLASPTSGSGAPAIFWFPAPPPDDPSTDASGLNVALQHGAFSSGATWSTMAPAIEAGFDVGIVLRETLDWRKELESQARELHGRLAASGRRDFLVVGHSNGGLVARRAAQLSAAAGDSLVRGVVTIATAHAGVPLATVGRTVVHDFLTTQLRAVVERINGSCWRGQFAWLCDVANLGAAELPSQVATFALDAALPMSRDVQPGSAFLAALAATPESFRRYSIEVSSQGQWKFLRLLGDWRCEPSQSCGGNKLQNTMESVYEILRICGSNTIMRARLGHVSDKCRNARWTLSSLNAQYERWTAPGTFESDGLVPLKSQAYPGAFGRLTRKGTRDSHASELKSGRVRDDLVTLVNSYLKA